MAFIYEQQDGRWALQRFDGTVTSYPTEQEARMAEREPAIAIWERGLRDLIQAKGREIMQAAMALGVYADDNDIDTLIATTAAGALIEGSTITKEDAAGRKALLDDLLIWLNANATGQDVTRRKLINGEF